MKLFELFDNPSGYDSRQSGDIIDYESTLLDGSILEVEFYKSVIFQGRNNWFLSFSRREAGSHSWTRSTEKTGQGNEVDVMSTVVSIATEFCNKYEPDTLQFVAAKVPGDKRQMSRANLYHRMANRLGAGKYDVKTQDDGEAIKFIMVKKGFDAQPNTGGNNFDEDDF